MKKVIAALTLFFMIAEINFPVEARLNLIQKVGDLVKGRKSNEDTRSLDQMISTIKGLGSSFASSGSAQFKYVNSKFLNTTSDLTFLMAYSSFAKNSELFFTLLESLLAQIRKEYTTSLGAQNRMESTTSELTRQKQGDKDELSKNNMQRCLEVLISNGFQALQANLQCSSIILLKVMQKGEGISDANLRTVQNQIDALSKKFSIDKISYIQNNLADNLSSASNVSQFSEDISSRIESITKSISLVSDVLGIANRYVHGENFSGENRQAQIDEILGTTDYSSGAQDADSDENDDDEEMQQQKSVLQKRRPTQSQRTNEEHDDEESDDGEEEEGFEANDYY